MRLLHTTHLTFEEFFESEIPNYAILSHRWISGQEISYEDFLLEKKREATGWEKIRWFASVARDVYQLEWCWVDTCCIDKKSSAELSEAINSMYKWYKRSSICIAFLSDVDTSKGNQAGLEQSQWFKRGWTLQELLAPQEVVFYQGNRRVIGTKMALREALQEITRIPAYFLQQWVPVDLREASVAERMSWASQRETTRVEDVAYCLLGIFNVNMPLLYGEGEKAFIRLQQEIINQSDDESIFAWTLDGVNLSKSTYLLGASMLANSPRCFANSGSIRMPIAQGARPPYSITNKGLDIQVHSPMDRVSPCVRPQNFRQERYALLQLECYLTSHSSRGDSGDRMFLLMSHVNEKTWARVALPFHIRGERPRPLQFQSIRVRESPLIFAYPLEGIDGVKDTGVMDIGMAKDLTLIDFGLEAKI